MDEIVVYNIAGEIRIAEGPKDSIIVYRSSDVTPLEFSGLQGVILKYLREIGPINEHDLLEYTGATQDSLRPALDSLMALNIVSMEASAIPPNIEPEQATTLEPRRNDRYGFFLVDVYQIAPFRYLTEKINFFNLHSIILPWMLLLAFIQLYSFYLSPSRSLGKEINLSLIYSPSIFQVLLIFLACNLATVLYKIAVGKKFPFGSGNLHLRLLAGFSPFFASDKDPSYSQDLGLTKLEYFLYIAAPQILQLYLMMLSIFFIELNYPFATRASEIFLAALFTIINLSLVSFFWQAIPSPGNLSYKTLEILNIIPSELVGLSLRKTLKGLSRSHGDSSIGGLFRDKRYKIFLISMLAIVLGKVAFLLFIVLPQVSIGLPTVFGRWSSQIFYVILLFALVRYITYTFAPRSKPKPKDVAIRGSSNRVANGQLMKPREGRDYAKTQTNASQFQQFTFKKSLFAQRWFVLVMILILLLPIPSTVVGSATVEERMSLEIKSSEPETVTIKEIFQKGPSSEIVKKGSLLLQLDSLELEYLIEKTKSNIQTYKSDVSLLIIEAEALKQGSRVMEAKGKSDTVEQDVESQNAKIQEISSLERQLGILNDQVRRYKLLVASGAVSELQYQEKLLEAETAQSSLNAVTSELKKAAVELRRSRREELLEQNIKIGEDLRTNQEQLIKDNAALIREENTLAELQRRRKALTVTAPFDCVVNSDTSLLLGKTVVLGETLISVKSVPTEFVVIDIPEYDRSEVQIGDRVEVRLYTTYAVTLHGEINSISPVALEKDSQEQLSLGMKIDKNLPDALIGSTGTAKIRAGYSCLLLNLFKPIVRFVYVDLWQFLP